MNHENETAKGHAFKHSFTVATALLAKALVALHTPVNNLSPHTPIFDDLHQTLSEMRQSCLELADDQSGPFLENQLALLDDILRLAKCSHPSATLEDSADELSYLTKLIRAKKDVP